MKFAKYIGGALVVLLIVSFSPPRLSAYDKNQRFKAYNPGLEPCSEIDAMLDRRMEGYTAQQQADYEQIVRYWLAGFGTAWNYIMPDTYDIQGEYTTQQIWDWLENYCEKNPDKKLVDAIVILVQALHPNRTQNDPGKNGKILTRCLEPRPQICTREYRPVCAQLSDGTFKTYATGCTACTDPDVTAYRESVCE